MPTDEEEDDDLDDRDDPIEEDVDPADWDETDTNPCPYCRKPIAEEAEWCPHCGKYISQEDAPGWRKPLWIFVGIALALLSAIAWVMMR